MWLRISFSIAVLLSLCLSAHSQTEDELIVQEVIEYLLETSETEFDFTDLQQNLLMQLDDPVNLNKASFDDLKRLQFLTENEIISIINHRRRYGDFLGTFELQAVVGLNQELLPLLQRFTTCKEYMDDAKVNFGTMLKNGSGSWLTRYTRTLEKQEGYLREEGGFQGSPYQLYSRINYKYKNRLSLGITAEKDAGEEFFKGSQPQGFDYLSAHFYYRGTGILKKLAVGDYQAQFGQGLSLWSGLSFGKSAQIMNVARRERGILPYRSANENQFMRGAAATINLKNFDLTAFFSRKNVDGNLQSDDTLSQEEAFFTSLQISGMHRTQNEIADKNAIGEDIFGGNISWNIKNLNISATSVFYEYDLDLNRNLQPYQLFAFNNSKLNNSSIAYNGLWGRAYLFGEVGLSDFNTESFSSINGLYLSLSNKVDFVALHRHYAKNFNGLYNGPFAEQSRANNETGLYTGLHYKANQKWTLKFYLDQFQHRWLRFRTDQPSRGIEYLTEIKYRPSRSFEAYGRLRTQIKEQNVPNSESRFDVTLPHNNTHLRLQVRQKVNKAYIFTTRAEGSNYSIDDSTTGTGILLYQDFAYKPIQSPISFVVRYAIFNVDNFDARIYAYENDVLYGYSIPFFQNRGHRYYAVVRYKLGYHFDVWARFARTTYYDQESISSGLGQINDNKRSDIRLQVRYKF